jgi:thioesterase domain-containing protein/acyl carrier protein
MEPALPLVTRLFGRPEEAKIWLRSAPDNAVALLHRPAEPTQFTVRETGAYLIVGGPDEALETAEWLAAAGAKHLVLSTEPRTEDYRLQSLRERGIRVDSSTDGTAIAGVFVHLSGDRIAGGIDRVLALHEATLDHRLDAFVCLGSTAGLLGLKRQGAQAALDAFAATFAPWRRALGLPALTVFRPDGTALGGLLGRLLARGAVQAAILPGDPAGVAAPPDTAREPLGDRPGSVHDAVRDLAAATLGLRPDELQLAEPLFALGLDSMMSIELRNQIAHRFGITLPLEAFLANPTVAELAETVEAETGPRRAPAPAAKTTLRGILVPLQSLGAGTPLFCVHPWAGVAYPYQALARSLAPDRPVYGLQAAGLFGPPDSSIAAMADRYADAITERCPDGPIALAGWSFGAPVAFELARRLDERGRIVSHTILLDPPRTQPSMLDWLRFTIGVTATHIWPYAYDYLRMASRGPARLDSVPEQTSGRLGLVAAARTLGRELRSLTRGDAPARRVLRTVRACSRAMESYRPQPWCGRLTILRLSDHIPRTERDATAGWGAVALGGTDVAFQPGHHLRILRQPHVAAMAAWLRTVLAPAVEPETAPTDTPVLEFVP